MATITKKQIIALEKATKELVKTAGGSLCDRLESALLAYDNVYVNGFGDVTVRLANGDHVSLYDIV